MRNQVVIATKVRVGDSATANPAEKQMRAHLDASLKRLATVDTCVDTYTTRGILSMKGKAVHVAHIVRDKKKLLNRVRRIKGQIDAIERSLEEGVECSQVLHTVAACRGAIDGLMSEVIEGHIRFHVVDPDHHPTSERAKAAQELIDVIRMYMK